MRVYVGVDWDIEAAVCCFGEEGAIRREFRTVKLEPEAVTRFIDRLVDRGASEVVVGIEPGHELWVRLLHGCGQEDAPVRVHVIDGKRVRRFGESLCSSGAQDDPRSAESLFEMLHSPKHRREPWRPLDKGAAQIARTCRMHATLTREVVRVTNRLRAELNNIAPALNVVLKDLTTVWARRLLAAAPTPGHLQALSDDERSKLRFGRQNPDVILEAYGAWTDVPAESWRGDVVRMWVAQLDLLCRQRKTMDTRLQELVAADPIGSRLLKMVGVGPKLGAGLVEHAFSGNDLSNRDSAGICMGVAPVTLRSGKRGRANPIAAMRRAGPAYARAAGYQLGMQAVKHIPWAKAQFDYYVGKRHHKAAGAYRRVARSLLRILTALVRDGAEYDERRYVQILIGRGVPWAANLEPSVAVA